MGAAPFNCALQALYLADNVTHAIAELNLSNLSADEEAVLSLAQLSREIVPALAELRTKATDRTILQTLLNAVKVEIKEEGDVNEVKDESDGETSVPEFGISDSDGEVVKKETSTAKQLPMVLPAGWRVEHVNKKGREHREFVDPSGCRYTNFTTARKAIDQQRARENMTKQVMARRHDLRALAASEGTSPTTVPALALAV